MEKNNLCEYYSEIFKNAIEKLFDKKYAMYANVEPARDLKFGDLTTNVAMIISKQLNKSPVQVAQEIIDFIKNNEENLTSNDNCTILQNHNTLHNKNCKDNINNVVKNFENLNIKGPGFINWHVSTNVLNKFFIKIFQDDFGKAINDKKINIEYVSANPTGPLHAGHARCAVVADVLANILQYVGYDVVKEYYINDAGMQMIHMFNSFYYRYLNNELISQPLNFYPGEYLTDSVKKFESIYKDKYKIQNIDKPKKFEDLLINQETQEFITNFVTQDMMDVIKNDLKALNITHDVFVSEKEIIKANKIQEIIEVLQQKGFIYSGVLPKPKTNDEDWSEREQLLFKSTLFGDDIDRPLQKSDGSWTYFASDIAYHYYKLSRNYDLLINYWGADHGGYILRVKAVISAIVNEYKKEEIIAKENLLKEFKENSENNINTNTPSKLNTKINENNKKSQFDFFELSNKLDVKICQIVRFMQNGQEVRMSKRAGTFITARDVIDQVGVDVLRFMMITRRDDAQLDFDFEKVVEQCKDNPVFYAQYAYARTHSILRNYKNSMMNKHGNNFIDNILTMLNKNATNSENNNTNKKQRNSTIINQINQISQFSIFTDVHFKNLILKLLDFPRQLQLSAKDFAPHKLAYYIFEVSGIFHSLWNMGNESDLYKFINENDLNITNEKICIIFAVQNVFEIVFDIIGITPRTEL